MGPPPHSPPWDDCFFITKGTGEFTWDGQHQTCEAGTFVYVPGGTIHGFNYGPGGGEMLEITSQQSRAVDMFTALDQQIPAGPPDVAKVVQVAGDHGATIHI